jgi:[acyl-carrier-protein] S-malonyltransferase
MDAWVFPGQGSQASGMGAGLTGAEADRTFGSASSILGWDVRAVCEAGPEEYLRTTEIAQPALLTVCVAAARTLAARGLRPDLVAGHSVGEFAALVAAGLLSFDDALRAVIVRAGGMARAGRDHPGAMAAVLGLGLEGVEALCTRAGDVVVANVNGDEQVVISGTLDGIERARSLARSTGAKRVMPLNVSVAAHSPLMAPAADDLAHALRSMTFEHPAVPFASGFTGAFVDDPAELPSLLAAGVTGRVRWVETVHALAAAGAERFVEVGPGSVLSGLIRRIVPDAIVVQAGNAEAFAALVGSSHAVR